jgi:hypothetical protein
MSNKTNTLEAHIVALAKPLLERHSRAAEEAAMESGDEKAAVTIKAVWAFRQNTPAVKVEIKYTTSHKDEAESVFNPDQTTMELEDDESDA